MITADKEHDADCETVTSERNILINKCYVIADPSASAAICIF